MTSVIGKPLGLINLGGNSPGIKRMHNGTAVIVSSNSALSPQLPSFNHQAIKSEQYQQAIKSEQYQQAIKSDQYQTIKSEQYQQIKSESLSNDRGTVLVTNNNNNNTNNNNINNNNNSTNNNNNSNSDLLRCKRRINFAYSNMANHQPASVARRNARERNRVKQVNNGFATLRSHIPVSGSSAAAQNQQNISSRSANKKLSKVETLRMAVDYIRSLQELLDGTTHSSSREQSYYQSEDSFKMESLSPPCSENSSSPPPSSYTSEGSYNTPAYAPMSPEDEDLLDVISLWQQSQ